MPDHTLKVSDLTVSYDRVPALHHVTFEAHCGQSVALMGPNGAGKTTLLKTLAGLMRADSGRIEFHGRKIGSGNEDFAYLPQRELVDWDFPLTVRGLVEMGRYLRIGWLGRFKAADGLAVDRAMEAMRLQDVANRQISALSGGQQQRAFLARSLAQEAHVFLLDEPFSGLDKTAQESLASCLRDLAKDGKLIVASHHDLKSVRGLFSDVLLLNGELIAAGSTKLVFNGKNIERTYDTQIFSGRKTRHALAH